MMRADPKPILSPNIKARLSVVESPLTPKVTTLDEPTVNPPIEEPVKPEDKAVLASETLEEVGD